MPELLIPNGLQLVLMTEITRKSEHALSAIIGGRKEKEAGGREQRVRKEEGREGMRKGGGRNPLMHILVRLTRSKSLH